MRCLALGLLLSLWSSLAIAQGCGPSNPNCIVPTAPAGTSDNRAASTAYVQQGTFLGPIISGVNGGVGGSLTLNGSGSGSKTINIGATNTSIGIGTATPGSTTPFPCTKCFDLSGTLLLQADQQTYYAIGGFSGFAAFQQSGASSPAYAFTLNNDTSFRLIYDTQSFCGNPGGGCSTPHVVAVPQIWTPIWTYIVSGSAGGVNPGSSPTVSYPAATAIGWNQSSGMGETNVVNRTFFNTTNSLDFALQDWNGTTLTNLLTIAAPSNTTPGFVTIGGGLKVGTSTNGVQVGAPTGGDKGAGTINIQGTIWTNGTQGLASRTCTVNQALTLIFTNGLLTGGTCIS